MQRVAILVLDAEAFRGLKRHEALSSPSCLLLQSLLFLLSPGAFWGREPSVQQR
jgi:hypothetical protein